ncbi:transposase family protein [Micromonospora olivasterospora]|uniref:transposase family protein n=1 Tax=Micromonospora olivasterospora TaxID=1880 RepID=UPI003CCC8D4F
MQVAARTAGTPEACPQCGQLSDRVHAYHQRQLADLPVGGRAVIVHARVRRLVCAAGSCSQRTFREQVPVLAQRWARRTRQLTSVKRSAVSYVWISVTSAVVSSQVPSVAGSNRELPVQPHFTPLDRRRWSPGRSGCAGVLRRGRRGGTGCGT